MIASADDALNGTAREFVEQMAIPYWSAIVHWYELVGIGVTGKTIDLEVRAVMDRAGLARALNPGHLTGVDDWIHGPIRPDSADQLRSKMALQCDIILVKARPGWAANCEDTIALADEALREELREHHPETWGGSRHAANTCMTPSESSSVRTSSRCRRSTRTSRRSGFPGTPLSPPHDVSLSAERKLFALELLVD
jgi:hypothetical protein